MDPATDALRRIIEEVVDSRLATWQSAKPVEPAPVPEPKPVDPAPVPEPKPVDPAPVPEPKPAPTGWITNRAPEAFDGDSDGDVYIPSRIFPLAVWIHWSRVHIGTPWVPGDATPAAPWDPTTLDRNGWIRSRLPTKADAPNVDLPDFVLIPTGGIKNHLRAAIAYYLVTPGQPWAPCGSNPGSYEP